MKKVIRVDVDGTICSNTEGDYESAIPDYNMITKINDLYDAGNTIIYWTARGTTTGIDWMELTKKQLNEWGCKYHNVELGKPYYDLYIDDKSISINEFLYDNNGSMIITKKGELK